ncbi:MAG TPA: DUF459 domain-containing protein [Gaiella sp.]|jgi:hypothetical protein|nr:DUF459 domain-containing protein [Gaiella sp.]
MAERPLPPLPPLPEDETRTLERAATGTAEAPPSPPERPSPRRGEGPRRREWSAGHALVVCVLALAIGLLLNAPGIHKSAYNKPDGWQRDVALAITGPLAGVSHALLLDRPREGVQTLVGRSGADEIDTDLGLPPPAPARAAPGTHTPSTGKKPPPASAPKRTRKLAFSPKRKLRIWVAGDSLVITPGYAIVRAAGTSPAMEPVGTVDGRVATGLTRPDVFNWFDEIRARVKELRPRAVVLGFGGNDDKAYMTGLPEGTSIGDFGSWSWRREYARRVGGLMDAINRAGAFVVWIGLPQTRSAAQTQRFDVVNAVVEKEARRREGGAAYVDTYTMFAGDDGGYAQYLPDGSGRLEKVRADDGVHFERAGGDMIARVVLKALNQQFDLTSWRTKQSAG